MKSYSYLLLVLFFLGGCSQQLSLKGVTDITVKEKDDIIIEESIPRKDSVSIQEILSILSGNENYILHPLDNFDITDYRDPHKYIFNFLFIDPNKKTIGIHFGDVMPFDYDPQWRSILDGRGTPYEKIFPALETVSCKKESFEVFPKEYASNSRFCVNNEKEFYYQPLLEVDFDTFEIWTGRMYGADKNSVYIFYRRDLPFYDNFPYNTNYESLKKKGIIQYPFYKIVESANPLSGNQSEDPEFLIQDTSVLHTGKMYWSEPYEPTF